MNLLHSTQKETAESVYRRFGTTLYRNALLMLRNPQDAEDMVQDTLIRYMEHAVEFHDDEHKKAWLLRVNINLCKNRLRFNRFHSYCELDEMGISCETEYDRQLTEELLRLPEDDKNVLLLYYVEGYKIKEIAGILRISENAVKKRMERARVKLSKQLEVSGYEGR